MSYILDALRKSDQLRQRGVAPMSLVSQTTMAEPKQHVFSLSGVLAVSLVGAGILIGWLRPWQPAQPVSASAPAAEKQASAGTRLGVSETPPVMSERVGTSQYEPPLREPTSSEKTAHLSGGAANRQDASSRANVVVSSVSANAMTDAQKTAPLATPDKSAVTDASDVELEHRVVMFNELPLAIQQEIPSLSISMHSYTSNPKDRFVMIGDKLLRQGEFFAPSLRLEQITSDGVVFSYKKYRFQRGVR
jgi:general secretion pathway protein B